MESMTEPVAQHEVDSYQGRVCQMLAVFVAAILVFVGFITAAPDGNLDVWDMTTLGIWAGAGAICLVVGVCAAAICRQLESLRPSSE